MPLRLQAKLLRVLEEKTVRPVGGNQETPVDVRIVAATNRDLSAEVAAGHFRADLFYRLNVVAVRLPPLRERPEDIPVLAELFLDRLSAELGLPRPTIAAGELEALCRYVWPGNVRELRNVIERCLLLGRPPTGCILQAPAGAVAEVSAGRADLSLQAVERRHILDVLAAEGGNKSAAARKLGVSRKTLERKVREWTSDE
jgi:DNA-binding NtrC family response regulator